jgi:hypothetical protein
MTNQRSAFPPTFIGVSTLYSVRAPSTRSLLHHDKSLQYLEIYTTTLSLGQIK